MKKHKQFDYQNNDPLWDSLRESILVQLDYGLSMDIISGLKSDVYWIKMALEEWEKIL